MKSRTLVYMNLLQDFSFKSNQTIIAGYSMHYIDEGHSTAPALLFLHGVPTWSYTFRRLISPCVESGLRVIIPDMIGFGLSEKPRDPQVYSLQRTLQRAEEFISKIDAKLLVLFAHDWGAVIGMLLASRPGNPFSGMILSNGLLPLPGMKSNLLFRIWRLAAEISPVLPIGEIVNYGCKRKLSCDEKRGYNYPFKSNSEKRAIRVMPQQLPLGGKHPENQNVKNAWSVLERWNNPVLTLFGDRDPITKRGEEIIQRMIPGAKNQDHRLINGGHFLQEDAPKEMSDAIVKFMDQF